MREGGSGKGERGKRATERRRGKEREGDSRDWMIRFQLWSAAVQGSDG